MTEYRRNLYVFGYGLSAILTFFGWRSYSHHQNHIVAMLLFIPAVVLLLVTILRVQSLQGFYERWMKVAHIIGTVVSTIILGVLFYVAFGLPGLILRILRKDLLNERLEPERRSYWEEREKKEFNKEHYRRQF